jgi:hypothetical protein
VLGTAAFLLLVGLFVPNLSSNSNSGNVQTADGPADPPPPLHEDPPPGEEPGSDPSSVTVPNFKQKYVYKDGVEFEFTAVETGKLTKAQVEEEVNDKIKTGDGWVKFTGRIRNGSKAIMDANLVFMTVTYGRTVGNLRLCTSTTTPTSRARSCLAAPRAPKPRMQFLRGTGVMWWQR